MRRVAVGGTAVDGGPTVFTMRWVFDGLLEHAGTRVEDELELRPVGLLARHAWREGGRLDLYADVDRSADAIAQFAGST
jgi:1-hydroxycarotenoid 3,4-desaturase